MLSPTTCLRPNKEEVAAKVIDGEAILINLTTGVYFSMDTVGALIWELIESGSTQQNIAAELCARYQVSSEQAQADVARITEELANENLIVVTEDDPSGDAPPTSGEKLEYQSPELNIYRDMGDLLALDPPTPGLEITPWQDEQEASEHADATTDESP